MKTLDRQAPLRKLSRPLLYLIGTLLLFSLTMASMQFVNDPRRLIGDYLTSQGYAYDIASAEIVPLGSNAYELIDPPLEPLTQTPLVKWQLYPLGHFVYYAVPIDLPPLHEIDLHLTLTDDDYQQLVQAAEQAGLSLNDLLAQYLAAHLF